MSGICGTYLVLVVLLPARRDVGVHFVRVLDLVILLLIVLRLKTLCIRVNKILSSSTPTLSLRKGFRKIFANK